jgi:hypothetical protein
MYSSPHFWAVYELPQMMFIIIRIRYIS